MSDPPATELLRLWHAGDEAALQALVVGQLPWLQEQVTRRLGPLLQRREDAADLVQDAAIEVLTRGPRFVPADTGQLRALLSRLVENLLRDRLEYHQAGKRDLRREQPLPTDNVVVLDPAHRPVTRPSEAAGRNEMQAWVQLALELLAPDDRRMILLRQWRELPFAEIGRELGIQENTARMRFQAALQRLGDRLRGLRGGRIADEDIA
jgi:RNA polymerase sigma factor (sigma-70 family)